jgi:hypothetical protein
MIFVQCLRLIARKVAVLFGSFNCGVRLFYTACRFDKLSRGRGSILCILNASFEKRSQRHILFFYTKNDDHGVRRGVTGQILALWRRPVASKVALDMLHWAMPSASYPLIRKAIKMAHNRGTFVCHRRLFRLTNGMVQAWVGQKLVNFSMSNFINI